MNFVLNQQVALLQSRLSKSKHKQRRIRAVDDKEENIPKQNARQNKKSRKKQSNFANDLTDTSRTATKRLRYDANQMQKGKGPFSGKSMQNKGKFSQNKGKMGPNKGKGNPGKDNAGKRKSFGKPKAAKQGRRKNK